MKYKVILASGSPRRCELLQSVGMDFEVIKSTADESSVDPNGIPVSVYVQELAMLKAMQVAENTSEKDCLVIGADTVVSLNNEIFGKPKDKEDAINKLKFLSGKTHEVYTGYSVVRTSDLLTVCGNSKTTVTFATLTDDEILNYVNTGEPFDKAGGYGIQGYGKLLVEKIEGDYFNVVGLPVRSLVEMMKKEFNYNI